MRNIANYRFLVLVFCTWFIGSLCAQEVPDCPVDTVNGEVVYRYQVPKSIGLYRIGVNFKVSQTEIVRLNPQLRDRAPQFGETLLIPARLEPKIKKHEPLMIHKEVKADTMPTQDTLTVVDSVAAVHPVLPDTIDGKPVVELALLLPFESHQTKRSANAERMMEFYQGALLALREAQNDTVFYRLRVIDSERSERRVNALCDSTELDHVRGVIGLAYPIQIERMAKWCEQHQVPLLLPFNDDTDLRTNPQILQFNSTDRQEADSLCRWIADRDSLLHCVVVDVRDADMSESTRLLRQQLRKNNISFTSVPLREWLTDSAAYALDLFKENLIILHSDRYQQVRMILPHLQQLEESGFMLRLVSQYSWQKENISLLQVYTSVFTAYDERTQYEQAWKQHFINDHVSETPRFDLLGHDLMKAMLRWLQGEKQSEGLQSDIRWQQVNENGGWQNSNVQVIER